MKDKDMPSLYIQYHGCRRKGELIELVNLTAAKYRPLDCHAAGKIILKKSGWHEAIDTLRLRKMAITLQTTYWYSFSLMKIVVIISIFNSSLFLIIYLTKKIYICRSIQAMAWCWNGNKALPDPTLTQISDVAMS